jgi:ATP-dependent DNA ligase
MRPAFGPRPVAAPGWVHQPKLNGWRALLHVASGALWSRHGRPLRHAERWERFATEIQGALGGMDVWLDCEAMGIRTTCQNLTVLDAIIPGTYSARRAWLGELVDPWLVPEFADPEQVIALGQDGNRIAGALIYEGVVSKRADSPYLMQSEVENKETTAWLKWRFPEAQP